MSIESNEDDVSVVVTVSLGVDASDSHVTVLLLVVEGDTEVSSPRRPVAITTEDDLGPEDEGSEDAGSLVVAAGLVVDASDSYVKLQLLAVSSDDKSDAEVSSPPPPRETTSDDDFGTESQRHGVPSPSTASEENTLPGAFQPSAAGRRISRTDEELKEMAAGVLTQFEDDRERHCELLETLKMRLQSVRQKKQQILKAMLGSSDHSPGRERHRLAHGEQLLKKVVSVRGVLEKMPTHRAIDTRWLSEAKDYQCLRFTKKPFPEWATAAGATSWSFQRPEKRPEYVHPLRDMVMRIDKIEVEGQMDYRIQWLPKKGRKKLEASAEQSTPLTLSHSKKTPTRTKPPTVPRTAALPKSPPPQSKPVAQESETKGSPKTVPMGEATGLSPDAILSDLMKSGLLFQKEEPPAKGPIKQETPSPVISTPSSGQCPSLAAAPAGEAESRPQRQIFPAKPPETQTPPMPQTEMSSLFQGISQIERVQASSIAGGAAFGQPSFPRSSFGVSNISPQLGSLGQGSSSIPGGGFSGFAGGGFSAFARQASPQAPPSQSPFGAFAAAGQQGTTHSGFSGSAFGSSTSSGATFGMKAASDSSKMWEMRK